MVLTLFGCEDGSRLIRSQRGRPQQTYGLRIYILVYTYTCTYMHTYRHTQLHNIVYLNISNIVKLVLQLSRHTIVYGQSNTVIHLYSNDIMYIVYIYNFTQCAYIQHVAFNSYVYTLRFVIFFQTFVVVSILDDTFKAVSTSIFESQYSF